MAETCDWTGRSGKVYTYNIYPFGTNFEAAPGNYIFAKHLTSTSYSAIYIGETQDFSERFDNHHKIYCITQNGATHIHVHVNTAGEAARLDEEKDLKLAYMPPCND